MEFWLSSREKPVTRLALNRNEKEWRKDRYPCKQRYILKNWKAE